MLDMFIMQTLKTCKHKHVNPFQAAFAFKLSYSINLQFLLTFLVSHGSDY
jgi:hypothetical protein